MAHPTEAEAHFGIELSKLLMKIVAERFEASASISIVICVDCSVHIHKNVSRLIHTHQGDGLSISDVELDPLKVIANVAFWIRKLKPISLCFRNSDDNPFHEIANVNERVSTHIAEVLTVNLALKGDLEYLKRNNDVSNERFAQNIISSFDMFDAVISNGGRDGSKNTIRERMAYDMRYRTYGPHHITHALVQAVSMAQAVSTVVGK